MDTSLRFDNATLYTGANVVLSSFYRQIANAGVVPLMVAVQGLKTLIGIVGIVTNVDLVYVTWRNKSLHGTCQVLIAANALWVAVYLSGFLASFWVAASGWNLIRLDLCFGLQFLPVFGKYFALAMMCAIGADRLKSVIFWKYKGKTIYISFWVSLCSCISLYLLYVSFLEMSRIPDILVMCSASEISKRSAATITYNVSLFLSLCSPLLYSTLGAVLWMRQAKIPAQSSTRRIFKSIFWIMAIEFAGWGTNSVYTAIGVHITDYASWAWTVVFNYLTCVAAAATAPTLYFCNDTYRQAFRAQFGVKSDGQTPNARNVVVAAAKKARQPPNNNINKLTTLPTHETNF